MCRRPCARHAKCVTGIAARFWLTQALRHQGCGMLSSRTPAFRHSSKAGTPAFWGPPCRTLRTPAGMPGRRDAVIPFLSFISTLTKVSSTLAIKFITRWGHAWLLCVAFEHGVRAPAGSGKGTPHGGPSTTSRNSSGSFPPFWRELPKGGLRRVRRRHAVEERQASPRRDHVLLSLRPAHPPAFSALHGASLVAEVPVGAGCWTRCTHVLLAAGAWTLAPHGARVNGRHRAEKSLARDK